MIHRNAEIKDTKLGSYTNIVLLEFGQKDITLECVTAIKDNSSEDVVLVNYRNILQDESSLENDEDLKLNVVMVFNKVESIDIVMNILNSAKETLIQKQNDRSTQR